jgi:hypothetical protein
MSVDAPAISQRGILTRHSCRLSQDAKGAIRKLWFCAELNRGRGSAIERRRNPTRAWAVKDRGWEMAVDWKCSEGWGSSEHVGELTVVQASAKPGASKFRRRLPKVRTSIDTRSTTPPRAFTQVLLCPLLRSLCRSYIPLFSV